MGYKVILGIADRVYLDTGPEGTMIGIEMRIHPVKIPSIGEAMLAETLAL